MGGMPWDQSWAAHHLVAFFLGKPLQLALGQLLREDGRAAPLFLCLGRLPLLPMQLNVCNSLVTMSITC